MARNKFTVDGTTYIDLSTTGIESAADIPAGKIGYLRTGERVTGTGENMSNNPLSGKILSVNGDSICEGVGYDGGYAGIIGTENGMTVQNIGVSGGTITPIGDNHTISTTISSMRSDADYIILEGGINDAIAEITLGSISNGYSATLDTSTYAGAFENMLKSAIARFPGKKIGYIFVHKVQSGYLSTDGANSYYGIAKMCCEKWGVPYLDLNTLVPPLGMIDALKTAYTANGGDGLHPNEDGYRLFYVPKITAWMKTL